MPTLAAYSREIVKRFPDAGEAWAIASLAVGSAVVSGRAIGSLSTQKYEGQYMLRRDTSQAADRQRRCSSFTAASGTFSHTGTNYADTTATSETLEVLRYEPFMIDNAIDLAIQRLHRLDIDIVPARTGVNRYWLGNYTWIQEPGDIVDVGLCSSPVLSRDRYLNKFNTVNTSGVLQPDSWTLAGAAGTMVRSTTQVDPAGGPYSIALTRSGTNLTLSQTVGLLDTGVSAESLAGGTQTVTAVARGWSSVASQVRVQLVATGDGTTNSSWHTGGSGWEELSAERTLASTATTLICRLAVDTDNAVVYGGQLYLIFGTLNDSVRRDNYAVDWLGRDEWSFDQSTAYMQLYAPVRGQGSQIVLRTKRAYPGFDATRLTAGSSDAGILDAPLTPVAVGAMAELFRALAGHKDAGAEDRVRYTGLWSYWNRQFEQLALEHLGVPSGPAAGGSFPFPRRTTAWPARV